MKTTSALTAIFTAFATILLTAGFQPVLAADSGAALSPEMAAKADMVRSQQKQRVTPAQRKAAADALKLQREKIDQAKKAAAPAAPDGSTVK